MRKQLISFAQVVKYCKISSARGGLTPIPLAYALGGDNKVHDFTLLLRNDLNFSAWWCIPLIWKANVLIIYNIPYPNKLFTQSDVTITFLGVRKTFSENGKSLENFSIWWENWTTPVTSFKGSKTVASSWPFTNAKLPSLFVGTKRIAQAELKWKINFKRTIQFIKGFDSE